MDILLIIFFFIYGVRMYYNIFVEQLYQLLFVNRFTCIVYYMFICILPYVICRRIPWNIINFRKVLWTLWWLFVLGLVIAFKSVLSILASGDSFFNGRADANTYLDTIGYGHTGLSLVLICFSLISFYKRNKWKWLFSIPIILGLVSMGLANSRSPFVALFAILALYLCLKLNFKIILTTAFCFIVLLLNLDSIDLFFKEYFNSPFIERTMTLFELGSALETSSGRDLIYEDGIKMFLEHPIIGKAIILTDGEFRGSYVHNIFLEVFMGLGLVGGGLFLFIMVKAMKIVIRMIKENDAYLFFALIFVQYLTLLQFSRTLMFLPVFWASLGCLFSFNYNRIEYEKNSNSNS